MDTWNRILYKNGVCDKQTTNSIPHRKSYPQHRITFRMKGELLIIIVDSDFLQPSLAFKIMVIIFFEFE